MEEIKAYLAALGIGLSLGLIGAGGSVITIPVFVYVLKKDPLSSAVYSMFVVASSTAIGSIRSVIKKQVNIQVFLRFGIPSVAGVLIARLVIFPSIPHQLGSIASHLILKDMAFMLSLAIVMLLASASMLRAGTVRRNDAATEVPGLSQLMIRGFLVGLLVGMLGIGGGFLIVPALYVLARLEIKQAIATALLIISVNATFGFLASFRSINIDWLILLKFAAGTSVGILAGRKLAAKLSGGLLKKIFGYFLLILSAFIIYKQFWF